MVANYIIVMYEVTKKNCFIILQNNGPTHTRLVFKVILIVLKSVIDLKRVFYQF